MKIVPLHETLALRVLQEAALTTAACDARETNVTRRCRTEAKGTSDSGRRAVKSE
jgi:hypothetical protein